MEHGQLFQDNTYAAIRRRPLKGDTIPIGRTVNSVFGNMDRNCPQQQVPHQPTTRYLLEPFPFSAAAGSFGSGENGDSLHSVGQSILAADLR